MPLRAKHWLLSKMQNPEKTPIPEIVSGPGVISQVAEVAKRLGCQKPLVVSDAMLLEIGLVTACTDGLTAAGLEFAVYAAVVPNPPVSQVEEGYALYVAEGCDGIIAIGGGSPMDCAKIIGAQAMWGGTKGAEDFVGTFKVAGSKKNPSPNKFPTFIAVPTTAGTGSETTLAAVISFPEKHLKLTIADAVLIPKVAVLDPGAVLGIILQTRCSPSFCQVVCPFGGGAAVWVLTTRIVKCGRGHRFAAAGHHCRDRHGRPDPRRRGLPQLLAVRLHGRVLTPRG